MRLRDWLISRQRYWGTPIPIVYCPKCGTVPETRLPVLLPEWEQHRMMKDGSGAKTKQSNVIGGFNLNSHSIDQNPLHSAQFQKCMCPICGSESCRQTDTMDTFMDSSWYYLRYLSVNQDKSLFNRHEIERYMPVSIYIGGMQHATMHLLYARFMMRFIASEYGLALMEPFTELVVQGLVKGKSYRLAHTGQYIRPEEAVNYSDAQLVIRSQKMSKSKLNGTTPEQILCRHQADTLRVALLFASPPEHDIPFSEEAMVAAERFINRVKDTFHIGMDLLLVKNEFDHSIVQSTNKSLSTNVTPLNP